MERRTNRAEGNGRRQLLSKQLNCRVAPVCVDEHARDDFPALERRSIRGIGAAQAGVAGCIGPAAGAQALARELDKVVRVRVKGRKSAVFCAALKALALVEAPMRSRALG